MIHIKKLLRHGVELNFVSEFLKFSLEPYNKKWKNKNAIYVLDTLFMTLRNRFFTATNVVLFTNKTSLGGKKIPSFFSLEVTSNDY